MKYDWIRFVVQPPIIVWNESACRLLGQVGCLLGGSFLTKLVALVQLPAASLPNSRPTRLRLRAQENTAELSSVNEDQEDSDTTDVLYRAVRKAGRAHLPDSVSNIEFKTTLIKGKQLISTFTAFTTLRLLVSIVCC